MVDRDTLIAELDRRLVQCPSRVGVLCVTVDAGLEALAEVARRLDTLTGPDDALARLSAATFFLLCHAPAPAARAVTLTTRARAILRAPARVDGHLVHVSVQTGFATAHAHGPAATSAALIGQAQASVARRLRAAG